MKSSERRNATVVKTSAGQEPVALSRQSMNWPLIALGLVIAAAAICCMRPITDSDFWHHLSFGRIVVEQQRFPKGDELSYTAAGRPWISSGWLPSVLLYKAHMSSPDTGAIGGVVRGVTLVLGLFMFFWGIKQFRNLPLVCFLTMLALAAASPRFLPRPDIFSVLLIAPLMAILVWYERVPLTKDFRGWLRVAMLPLLFLLWANCHMLFVIGFAVASLFMVWALLQNRKGTRTDAMLLVIAWVLSGLACLATPYGISSFWFIIENAQLNATSTRINELKPLLAIFNEPAGASGLVFFGLWLVVCGWLAWRARSSMAWWQWMTIALLIGLALLQRRQIALAATGITPLVLAGLKGGALPNWTYSRWAYAVPLIFGVILFGARWNGLLGFPPERKSIGTNCEWFPCESIEFLRTNPPPAGLFHDLYTGGYLGYHLAPDTKVFIDGRLEVFNNGSYDDFFAPPEGRQTLKELFAKYDVKSVLLDWRAAGQQPGHTAAVLSDLPDWQLCWFSDHYSLFVHKDDQTTSYTDSHGYRYLNPLRPDRFMAALGNAQNAGSARAEARRAIQQNPESNLAKMAMGFAEK